MLIKKLTLLAFLVVIVTGINLAATYYVDANSGNDANSGTSASSAWNTISKVNSKSFSPGDNILFLRGCSWTGTLNFNSSGSSSSPIVYGSYGSGSLPIIDANNANAAGIIQSKNYITVQYIKFQNAGASPGGTIRVSSAIGVVVQNCEFYLTTQGSVLIQNSSNCLISHNTVSTPTFLDVQTDGIYSQRNANNIYECNHIVISNTETTNHDDCIQSYEDTSLTIRNNYLEQQNNKLQNAQGIYMTDEAGTFTVYNNVVKCPNNQANIIGFDNDVTGTASLILYNNTVIGGGGNTLRIPHTATVTVKNNVFVTTYASTLIEIEAALGAGSVFDYNLYYRQDGGSSVINYTGSKTLTQWRTLGFDAHGLNSNPMLNDSLYPASNSPVIKAGTNLGGVFNSDKEGISRPQSGAPDLGAYEVQGTTAVVDDNPNTAVKDYVLAQNYPNPFNPSTVIKYTIGSASHVNIKVYDITGRLVADLVNENKPAGQYNVEFRGNNLASGTYIYTITTDNFTQAKKMLLIK